MSQTDTRRSGIRTLETGSSRSKIDENGQSQLWKSTSPVAAAHAAIALYGPSAATAAAYCALNARCGGRDLDYRFWLSVFKMLRTNKAAPP